MLTNEMRQAVTSDRRLFTYYTEVLATLNSDFTAAAANRSGDIDRSSGNVSKGLSATGSALGAVPIVGQIANFTLSVAAYVASLVNQKQIKGKQDGIERISGDFDPQNWSLFARELAINLTLAKQDEIKSTANLDPSQGANKRSAISDKDRAELKKMAKQDCREVMKSTHNMPISEIENGTADLGDTEFRTDLVSKIVNATQKEKEPNSKNMSAMAKEAVHGDHHHEHKHADCGHYTHAVIANEHQQRPHSR